ncbi:saccharopine dehydrogenase NADP-binding domain-containing protein [Kitasatospora sp. NPDC096147]|uniref:saccharopine dehydrogenase NADP-binding domain-containing protein n=1 Tax=Kitasatospora sp. NPDC096147 TaxID=3364093 RepID=UPI0037F2543E
MDTVLVIGAGDMGERLVDGLAASGAVRRVLVAGRGEAARAVAAAVGSARDCRVESVRLDASRPEEVAALLTAERPVLLVNSAAVRGPWATAGRTDPAAEAVAAAGLALRLPYQLPLVLSVMRGVRLAEYAGPVVNLSFPDVTGPVLARLGLAPTVGLGNAGMVRLRVRAALRAGRPEGELPLVRVLAHHAQVYGVMRSEAPADPALRCRVHLGEQGERADDLAYLAPPLAPGPRYNLVTAAAALPVLTALLPGGAPLRTSTASPGGLPGGLPVRIADGTVLPDLPPGLTLDEAVAWNERMAAGDGVDRIDPDGTVHLTEAVHRAVAGIDPGLAAPIGVADLTERAARLDAALGLTA